MNHLKKLLCLAVLASAAHAFGDANTISMLVPRSQSFNANRQMVGWNNPDWGINRKPQEENYHAFNLTFAYTRTFRDERLARCFFGDDLICVCDDQNAIRISGSAVADRNNTDWLADYFGLPRDYQSTVCFNPRISNFILDFSYYVGLDAWVDGMYFRIHGPFVHTKWGMNAQETCTSGNKIGYFQGYFSNNVVEAENLNKSFLDYANGCTPTINNDYGYGDKDAITWAPLCCSRIKNDCECDDLTENGFGEIRFVLGWNFVNDEEGDYHLGAGIYVAAPTGTRPGDDCENGRYLFQPIVGNGKHWELGAQVTAHHIWWRSEDEDKSFGWYLTANVTHMFNACQTRCFDLCSAGSNSRYMIAQKLDSNRNSDPKLNADTDPKGLEFATAYAPVANITTRQIESSIGAQGDVAFSLAYQSGGFQWDLGYDFWGRSCEDICLKKDCCPKDLGTWALKGDERVYGFEAAGNYPAVALAVTDSKANIHTGSNLCNGINYTGVDPDLNVNAPRNFYADTSTPAQVGNSDDVQVLPNAGSLAYTSKTPVVIKESDFDTTGTRGISNKIFTNFNYAWTNREGSDWTPWVSVGAEAEFGKTEGSCKTDCNTDCKTDCNTSKTTSCKPTNSCPTTKKCCTDCAISQWGVWFKVGASYN